MSCPESLQQALVLVRLGCAPQVPHRSPTAHFFSWLQEEYEKERAMVDAVMARIEAEEAAEAEARRKRQRDMQASRQPGALRES